MSYTRSLDRIHEFEQSVAEELVDETVSPGFTSLIPRSPSSKRMAGLPHANLAGVRYGR